MNMDINPKVARPRLNIGKLLFAGAAFMLLNGAAVFAYRNNFETTVQSTKAAVQFGDEAENKKAVPLSTASRKQIEGLAAKYPYRQSLLYILYRDAAAREDRKQAEFFVSQMAKLGWRNSAAQRSLLIRAARKGDYPDLLVRADALLRRGVQTDQILMFVFLFEQNPEVRKSLAEALSRTPPWRAAFFGKTDILRDPVQRTARLSTVNYLLGSGAKLTRDEIAPLVNALDIAGDTRNAESLWARQVGAGPRSFDYDPVFERVAKLDAERPDLVMPFEWRLGQGTGYTSYLESTGGVRVEWDGHGVPVFLSQRLRVDGTQPIKIALGLGGDATTASAAVDVMLVCRGPRGNMLLDRKDITAERDIVTFSSDDAPGCDMPELRISGALRDGVSPVDFTIRSVHASRA